MGALRERYVSAIISRRASASLFAVAGPLAASQASFIWGRPEILEMPLMVKVNAPVLATKLFAVAPSEKSRKTSSAMMAIWLAEHIWLSCATSSGLVKCPVGLLG